ncbi:MAG: hypothetical protein RBR43_00805 [Desulfuromonadaceae bacterium]|nr:hypothetical protein [Desulfuromonadaceae bacterium]
MPVSGYSAPTIPAPQWIKRTAVAEKMLVNGIPSKVEYFEADRDVEEVLKFYRKTWQSQYAGHAGYREAHVEPWHVISRLEQRHLLTVQVRQSNALSADGYLAVANLDEIDTKTSVAADIPKLAGSKVLNQNTSFDPGKKGEVVMLANKFSVATNGQFYRDHYSDRGWGVLQDQELPGARAMAFRRFGAEVRLVVNKTAVGSVVVINRVTSD